MDITEYMYYVDLITYISENDDSENAKILLKNSRYYLNKLKKLIDTNRDLVALKGELFRYKYNKRFETVAVKNSLGKYDNVMTILEPEANYNVPSTIIESTEKETKIRGTSKQCNSTINLLDLI